MQHVGLVLSCLLENKLFVKVEKCEFHIFSVSFLGFVVGQGQLSPDPAKMQAVADWPTPSSLQSFLGFASFYHHFIRDYSKVAAPLTRLTSTLKPFAWSEEVEGDFHTVKGTVYYCSCPLSPRHRWPVHGEGGRVGCQRRCHAVATKCIGPEAAPLPLLQSATVRRQGEL